MCIMWHRVIFELILFGKIWVHEYGCPYSSQNVGSSQSFMWWWVHRPYVLSSPVFLGVWRHGTQALLCIDKHCTTKLHPRFFFHSYNHFQMIYIWVCWFFSSAWLSLLLKPCIEFFTSAPVSFSSRFLFDSFLCFLFPY
jgi:hypothetical protein